MLDQMISIVGLFRKETKCGLNKDHISGPFWKCFKFCVNLCTGIKKFNQFKVGILKFF